jgi:hypothetical protein
MSGPGVAASNSVAAAKARSVGKLGRKSMVYSESRKVLTISYPAF